MGDAVENRLPKGWCFDENGALRRETVPSMKRRCRDWDYRSRCIYMITVELADRRSKALGRLLVGDHEGRWVEPGEAKALGPELATFVSRPPAARDAFYLMAQERLFNIGYDVKRAYGRYATDRIFNRK